MISLNETRNGRPLITAAQARVISKVNKRPRIDLLAEAYKKIKEAAENGHNWVEITYYQLDAMDKIKKSLKSNGFTVEKPAYDVLAIGW